MGWMQEGSAESFFLFLWSVCHTLLVAVLGILCCTKEMKKIKFVGVLMVRLDCHCMPDCHVDTRS